MKELTVAAIESVKDLYDDKWVVDQAIKIEHGADADKLVKCNLGTSKGIDVWIYEIPENPGNPVELVRRWQAIGEPRTQEEISCTERLIKSYMKAEGSSCSEEETGRDAKLSEIEQKLMKFDIRPALDPLNPLAVERLMDKIGYLTNGNSLHHLLITYEGDSGKKFKIRDSDLRKILNGSLNSLHLKGIDLGVSGEACLAFSKCTLQTLFITNLGEGQDAEPLSRALVSNDCSISSLALYNYNTGLSSLGEALKNSKLRMLILYFIGKDIDPFLTWEDLGGLEYLSVNRSSGSPHLPKLIKQSKVWYLDDHQVRSGSEQLLEAVRFHSKITHLGVRVFMGAVLEHMIDFLASPDCKLEHLEIIVHDTHVSIEGLLEALESNFQSRITSLMVVNIHRVEREEERCRHIVKRNNLFLEIERKGNITFERPTTAKLFICGHSGAGKTTIATNLQRKGSLPAFLQRHPTTQGIHIQPIMYKQNKLIICDIAGQEEYHSFHHYFMRGSDKNIFLVVCRTSVGIKEDLQYWLRFIVSHRPETKRVKVLIAINKFGKGEEANYLASRCKETANELVQEYSHLLEIVAVDEHNGCFEVVALKVPSLSSLKLRFETVLSEVLGEQPDVPSLCQRVRMEACGRIRRSPAIISCTSKEKIQKPSQIMEVTELMTKLFRADDGDEDVRMKATKFVIACMHDMGECLYFGLDFEGDSLLEAKAVLDVQWFVQQLVGLFIRVNRDDSPIQQQEPELRMLSIGPKIIKMCSEEHLEYTLTSLHKMGVLLPCWDDNEEHHQWTRTRPEKVIVPALLKNDYPGFSGAESEYRYWGRRLSCKDENFTLLPSGIFTTTQVRLREFCTKSTRYEVGNGWVSFEEDDVQVVVRVGGYHRDWTDRQFIDVMVMAHKDAKRCTRAERLMVGIRACIFDILKRCPTIELTEKIINPKHIMARTKAGEVCEHDINSPSIVVGVEDIYQKVLYCDLGYKHSWNFGVKSSISELLMQEELQKQVEKWGDDIAEDYEGLVGAPTLEPWLDFLRNELDKEGPATDRQVLQLLQDIIQHLHKVDQRLDRLEASYHDLEVATRITQKIMEDYGKKIMANCSRILDRLAVDSPRYPYVTNNNNMIAKLGNLFGTPVRLHFCCESRKGLHRVERFEGIQLTLTYEWFHRWSHVLVPAITVFCLAAKIAGSVVGLGGLFDIGIDVLKGGLKSAVRVVLGAEVSIKGDVGSEDLKELFQEVRKQANAKGSAMEDFMKDNLGLRSQGGAWLCEDCGKQQQQQKLPRQDTRQNSMRQSSMKMKRLRSVA